MRAEHREVTSRRPDSVRRRDPGCPASVGSALGEMRGLHVVTGPSGAGKTSWCSRLVAQAGCEGYLCVGVTSPAVYRDGTRVGVDLICLRSGERRALGAPVARQAHTMIDRAAREADHLVVGDWHLNRTVLAWGNQELIHLLAASPSGQTLLFIDELGPLEFERRQGLTAPLDLPIHEAFHAAFLVVRPKLLPFALERWPDARLVEIGSGARR